MGRDDDDDDVDEFYDDPLNGFPPTHGLSNDEMTSDNHIQVNIFTII